MCQCCVIWVLCYMGCGICNTTDCTRLGFLLWALWVVIIMRHWNHVIETNDQTSLLNHFRFGHANWDYLHRMHQSGKFGIPSSIHMKSKKGKPQLLLLLKVGFIPWIDYMIPPMRIFVDQWRQHQDGHQDGRRYFLTMMIDNTPGNAMLKCICWRTKVAMYILRCERCGEIKLRQ